MLEKITPEALKGLQAIQDSLDEDGFDADDREMWNVSGDAA